MRDRILQAIGLAAAIEDRLHATRSIITRGDDQDEGGGAGTATVDDEQDEDALETNEERDANASTDDELDEFDEDLDDEGRPVGRSGRTKKGGEFIDRLKSENAKLKSRLESIEEEIRRSKSVIKDDGISEEDRRRETRKLTAAERAKQRTKEIVTALRGLDKDDPQFHEKLYEQILTPIYQDQYETAEEISARTAESVTDRKRNLDRARERAEEEARTQLREAGFKDDQLDEALEELRDLSIIKGHRDPGWDQRMKDEEQIPYLVGELKKRKGMNQRNTPEDRARRAEHRKPMEGVIDGGARRQPSGGDKSGQTQGPGSILADLKRNREMQKKRTTALWRGSI